MALNILFIVGELVFIAVAYLLVYWVIAKVCAMLSNKVKSLKGIVKLIQHNLQIIFWLSFFLTVAVAMGFSGYLIYRGEFLPEYSLQLIKEIPDDFWFKIGVGLGESFGIIVVAFVGLRICRKLLTALCEKILNVDGISTNDRSIQAAFSSLKTILTRVTWLWVLGQSLSWILFPDILTENVKLVAHVYFIIALGILSWRFIDILIDTADGFSKKYSDEKNLIHYYDRLKNLIPLFRRSIEYMIYLGAATLAMEHITFVAPLLEWGPRLIRIIGIILLARIFIEVMRLVLEEILITRANISDLEKKSRLTIVPLLLKLLTYLAYFGVGVIVMQEAGLKVLPVLAGAGVLGIAVGLGAQDFMKDIINGFSILFEGYYLVGDYVEIGDSEGYVEELDILNTRLRDEDGRVHIIRNGEVKSVINYSKQYTYAVVEIPVALDSDIAEVERVVEIVGNLIIELPSVEQKTVMEGIDEIDATGMLVRTITRVAPGKHKIIGRKLRKIFMQEFGKAGIEVPYSHHVLEYKNEKLER